MRLKPFAAVGSFLVLGLGAAGCGGDDGASSKEPAVSSRAYKGHAGDLDMNNLVATYPEIAGTRLDDCQSCHTGGQVTVSGKAAQKNACDFCHYIPFPVSGATGAPATYEQTLNPYGLAYKNAGRTAAAVRGVASLDSDGDGSSNAAEIADLRYPGNANSKPGQARATFRTLDLTDLKAMPAHQEFLLANTSKQQFDTYAAYRGVKVRDLLTALGVDLTGVTGVTVISADGFTKDFSIDVVNRQHPAALFYSGLDVATKGADCGFVEYPATLPTGLVNGGAVADEQWLMLAYERDGGPMVSSYLDPVSGKINGEGPLRIIVPQVTPGAPDRGSSYSPSNCGDGYDYDQNKDHNAGNMVRAVMALRVNPMPAGVEEFDSMNGGWAYVDAGQLIVYGYGIQ